MKELGLRVTAPRRQVVALLQSSGEHLSAEQIHQQIKAHGTEIGLATVYRVLCQLEQASLVIRHCFSEKEAVYEWHDGQPHDHIMCIRCDAVHDFTDPDLEVCKTRIAQTHDFALQSHSVVMFGVCRACQTSEHDAT